VAELAVSQLIIELAPVGSRTADIEIYNDSDERSYVSVEPREIINAGLSIEKSFLTPDPEKLGLLVSPTRLVMEPRQRRRLRIATIGPVHDRERVYRVTVKPVAGEINGPESGLKLLVGYDLLVLVRPLNSKPGIQIRRSGSLLTIVNRSNASVELAEGTQCGPRADQCRQLPSKRLYPGASWQQPLPLLTAGQYRIRTTGGWSTIKF
jgi:P pilus assembly chaperone PapD